MYSIATQMSRNSTTSTETTESSKDSASNKSSLDQKDYDKQSSKKSNLLKSSSPLHSEIDYSQTLSTINAGHLNYVSYHSSNIPLPSSLTNPFLSGNHNHKVEPMLSSQNVSNTYHSYGSQYLYDPSTTLPHLREAMNNTPSQVFNQKKPSMNGSNIATEDSVHPIDNSLPRAVVLRIMKRAVTIYSGLSNTYSSLYRRRNLTNHQHSRSQPDNVPTILLDNQGITLTEDTIHMIQKSSQDFISFITNEANERCLQDKRKTLTGEDIIEAFESMGFDNYAKLLRIYLQKIDRVRRPKGSSSSASVSNSEEC